MTSNLATSSCVSESTFCLYGSLDGNDKILFTIHAAAEGWAGIGLGSGMSNADFYVGWKNSTGGYTISRRSPNGYQMPSPSSDQIASIVPLQIKAPDWATLAFSFSRPIQGNGVKVITPTSSFIYALANTPPLNPDSAQSSFSLHRDFGDLPVANFLSDTTETLVGGGGKKPFIASTPETYEKVLLAHGILFFIAWGLAPFAGIFIARYLKNRLGPLWYKLHLGLFCGITGLLSLVSFLLILLYKRPDHFNSTHALIGLVVVISTALQLSLGFIINALWDPHRKSPPVWDQLHWWFGRALFVLALANLFLGLKEMEETGYATSVSLPLTILFSVLIGLGILSLMYGQFKFGQTHDHSIETHVSEISS